MQADPKFTKAYVQMDEFKIGRRDGTLTVYDSASWHEKSWIAGIVIGDQRKAYDWNELKAKKVIHDVIGTTPVLIYTADEDRSLFAVVRDSVEQIFELRQDTLSHNGFDFDLKGRSLQHGVPNLEPITVYQEYWHSWRTFNPATLRYPE